jgi:hypothetical protein
VKRDVEGLVVRVDPEALEMLASPVDREARGVRAGRVIQANREARVDPEGRETGRTVTVATVAISRIKTYRTRSHRTSQQNQQSQSQRNKCFPIYGW